MDTDYQLAAALGEPPRKRRAAAMAAQKNWQMLNKDNVIDLDDDDDFYEVHSSPGTGQRASLPPQSSYSSVGGLKRASLPSSSMDLNRKKTLSIDKDYSPAQELIHLHQGVKAKKTFPSPRFSAPTGSSMIRIRAPVVLPRVQPLIIQGLGRGRMAAPRMAANAGRMVAPGRAQITRSVATVLIETDKSKRIIARTEGSQYRKAYVAKLHPNEPDLFPIVEGETEEIVGTYDCQEVIRPDDDDFFTHELPLIMHSETEEQTIRALNGNEPKDSESDIEVIEVVNENAVSKKSPRLNVKSRSAIKGHLDQVIGSLEMSCENCDDEYTDGLCVDCEDDIISEFQYKKSIELTKQYKQYCKSLSSTKNIKFIPEAQVTDPVGIVTTTVSETTRTIVTKPIAPRNVRPMASRQTVVQSQSISGPIPSVATMSMPTSLPPNFTILPITSTSGVATPLILAPSNVVGAGGPLSSPLRLILQPRVGGNQSQPTYVVLSQSSGNVVPSQGIIVSNSNPIYVQTPTNSLSAPLSTSTIRPRLMTSQSIPTQPIVTRGPTPRGRPPRYRAQTSFQSAISVNNGNQSIQANKGSNLELFNCLTNYKNASNLGKKISSGTVLTIKPLPFSWPSNIDDLINSLIKLDNALMKEKFKEAPIAWMVTNRLIVPPKCKFCQKGVCNQVSKSTNQKNEYWHCNNASCNRSYLIDRPRIFNGPKFDIPVSKLLFLIYYWSIQVDVDDLIKTGQIEMGTEKIFNVWSRLQKVCTFALQTKDSKLGAANREVEIASIQIGRFHVLGAMESGTHRVKLTVISVSEIVQANGRNAVMLPFVKWIEKSALVKTCETKFMALRDYGFRVVCQSKSEFLVNNKNLSLNTISGYLIHYFQRFFKDFDLTSLTEEILSNILDELLWRERFGTNPFNAFYNIIKHISEQCAVKKPDYDISVTQRVTPPQTGIRTPPANTYSRPPNQRQNANQLDETNSVFVEEYFYSSLKLKESAAKSISHEDKAKDGIQCHLCQMFFNNILIVKHLLEHLEKERRGRVRKGDNNETECKHCLRFFGNRSLHMHEEIANLRLVPFGCRICLQPLYARQAFIGHMKTSHFSGEMPFYCDICNYRSSFQKNLFDHFEASHSNCDQVLCPFCIRVFDSAKNRALPISQLLYRHLTTHYAIASVYDCDKCVLTFISKDDQMEHCFKGHNPSAGADDKFEVCPYVVSEEEKKLCVRAREQELFTPFLPNFANDANTGEENATKEATTDNKEDNVESLEISCEPNIEEFLSFEPEMQFDMTVLTEDLPPMEQTLSVQAIDCDYSEEQLKQILTNSFDIEEPNRAEDEQIEGVEPNPSAEPTEPIPEPPQPTEKKDFILSGNKRVICIECKTDMASDHMSAKMVCAKCHFTTHCKTAFETHATSAHTSDSSVRTDRSVLRSIPELVSYKISCSDCDFSSTDGNQIAKHMIESTHLDVVCGPLTETADRPLPTMLASPVIDLHL